MYHTSSISTENIIVVHLCIQKEKYYVIVTFFFISNLVNTPIKCNEIRMLLLGHAGHRVYIWKTSRTRKVSYFVSLFRFDAFSIDKILCLQINHLLFL